MNTIMPGTINNCSLNFFSKFTLTILFVIFSGLSIVAQTVNPQTIVTVSAADYRPDSIVAADSIVAGFGLNLTAGTEAGQDTNPALAGIQLPKTLQGTRVLVNGVEADLFYVGPNQINYLVPKTTALGVATIRVESQNGAFVTNGTLQIAQVAPGIFTATQDGSGVPAANVLRVKADNTQVNEPVSTYDAGVGRFLAKPIDLGPAGERVFLILYLTGVRNAPDPNSDGNATETVRVLVNGNELVPDYSGVQPNFVGLDQINVEIPRYLLGNSALDIQIKVNGLLSNRSNVEIVAPNLTSLNWRARGLAGRTIRNFATLGSYLFSATNEGVYRSSDNGANWVLGGGLPSATQFLSLAVSGNVIYAGSDGSGVYVSYDNGTTWAAFNTGLSGLALTINSLNFDGSTFYASTSGGVCRYNRTLNTWEALSAGLSGVDLAINTFLSDGGISYIATNGGVCRYNSTTNAWEAFRNGLPAATRILSLVSANGVLYAGTNGSGLCRYNRTTNQWEAVGGGLPSTGIVTSVIIDGRRCFVGTRGGGVFVSNDGGVTWQSLVSGLSANDIYALWLNGGAIFAGANLGGIFGAPLSSGNFVAYSQSVAVTQNTSRGIILGGTDFSLNPLTYSILFQPNNGTLSGTAPNLVYTPTNNFVGSDSFIFRINNGAANSAAATVYITISQSTMPPPNSPPVANAQSLSTSSGAARAVTLSASDTNGDALTYSVVTPPTNGTLSGVAPNLTYTPTAGFAGNDSFNFKANDGKADSNIATVTINVLANRAPVVNVPGSQTVGVGLPLSFIVSGSDPDAGQALALSVSNAPIGAIFSAVTGQFSWTPLASQVGSIVVSFTVTDNGLPQLSDTKTIAITVPNRAPVITVPGAQSTSTGQLITFAVSATDPDTIQTLTLSATNLPSGATFTAATGVFAWTPSAVGISTVSFTVTDNGNPALSDTKTVNISVTGNSPNGFWTHGGGTYTGTPSSILIDGSETFVGASTGVYRTTNNGATFTTLNNGLGTAINITGLSLVDTTFYAGTTAGLYRSTDRGANWTKVTANGVVGSIYSVVKLGTTLIAATPSSGIYYSTDGGAIWTAVPNTASTFGSTRNLVIKGSRAFIACDYGVFASTDGIAWTAANNGIAPTGNFRVVASLVVKDNLLYALDVTGLKVSADDGKNWVLVNSSGAVVYLNLNTAKLYAGGNGLFSSNSGNFYYSPDGGLNFIQMNTGDVPTANVVFPTYAATNSTIFSAAEKGSATNKPGVLYSPFPNITANRAPSIAVTGTASGTTGSPINLTFSATDLDAGQTITLASVALPGGSTFTPATGAFSWTPNTPGTYTVLISAKDNGTPALGDLEVVTITVTGPALVGNWSTVNPGTVATSQYRAVATSGTNVFVGDSSNNFTGVYKSTNNGVNWAQTNSGLTPNFDFVIWSLTSIGSNLYAGTSGGIAVSNNNGTSWTKLTGIPPQQATSIAAQGNTLFAGTIIGLYYSTDNGTTWTATGAPIATSAVNGVVATDGYVFAATASGFFRTANGGATWEGINPDPAVFSTFNATSLAINGATLYVGSANDGVYRSTNNGSTWTKLTTGAANLLPIGAGSFASKIAAGNDIVFASVSNGVYFSTDNGASWRKMDAGTLPPNSLANLAVSSTHVYAVNSTATVYVSPIPGT